MLHYAIEARRVDAHGGVALCRAATVTLDTDVRRREDAMQPNELLLAALAASILKNLERVAQQINFEFSDARIEVRAEQDSAPPRIAAIDYLLIVETAESDRRLALLHTNVRRQASIYNTLLPCTRIQGTVERAAVAAEAEHAVSG